MSLRSGFALAALPVGGVSMVTDGPPRVAIFVEATSASGGSRRACLLGGGRSSVVRRRRSLFGVRSWRRQLPLVRLSAGSGGSVLATALRRFADLRRRRRSADLSAGAGETCSARISRAGVPALPFRPAPNSPASAPRSVPARRGAEGRRWLGRRDWCCSTAAAGTLSVPSGSAGGGSTRSIASTGLGGFGLLRKHRFGSGAPRRVAGKFLVRRAEQRRRAKPEDQYRRRQHDRGEQKTEAGEHGGANSAFAGVLQRPLSIGNAVTTELAAFATQRTPPARSESG